MVYPPLLNLSQFPITPHGSCIKKEKQKEITDLLAKIHALEVKLKRCFDPADAQHLETLGLNLSQCLYLRAKDKLWYYAHCFYEQGKKCGWLLARQLKKQQDSRHVHSLTVHNRQIVNTNTIAAEFH